MDSRHFPAQLQDAPTIGNQLVVVPIARAPHQHALWWRDSAGRQQRHVLKEDRITIGRGDDVDLKLPSTAVSRQHAVVIRRPGEFQLADLNSLHGILLNGVQVRSADLRDGDVIQLADMLLVYEQA